MGLSKAPALALVADGPGPMLSGLRRPTVLLPVALAELPGSRLRMMLAHEVAHRVRHDLLWNAAFAVARALFFFHPLVHLVAREAVLDQEAAADELAVAATGGPVKSYGEMLLGLLRVDDPPLARRRHGHRARRPGRARAVEARPARARRRADDLAQLRLRRFDAS